MPEKEDSTEKYRAQEWDSDFQALSEIPNLAELEARYFQSV